MIEQQTSVGLLADIDLQQLRAKVQRQPVQGMFDAMARKFRQTSDELRARGDRFQVGNCGSINVTAQELEAGFIHALTGDEQALDHVHRMIDVLERTCIIDPPSWHIRAGGTYTSYFSHALVCLAARMCDASLDPRRRAVLLTLARELFIPDTGFKRVYQYGSGHNIPLTRHIASAICAMTWGQEAGHPQWQAYVDFGRDACVQYCRWGLDEAGFSYEGVGYGFGPAIYYLYLYADLLARNGGENLFETQPVLQRVPDAARHLTFPDLSSMAQISDLSVPDTLPWLCLTARMYGRSQDIALWREYRAGLESRVHQGGAMETYHSYRGGLLPILWLDDQVHPAPVDAPLRPTGICAAGTQTVLLRTSWSRKAVWLNVLGQGRSTGSLGHMHADAGHFSLFAQGKYLAVDSGYWNELEDQHNVVLVDGRNSRHDRQPLQTTFRAGAITRFEQHRLLDYVKVDQSAVKDARWAHRHFLFVPSGQDQAYIVVIDDLNPDDSRHEFWWQMHLHPASELAITGPASATALCGAAALDATFIIPSAGDYPTDPHQLQLRMDEAWCPKVEPADRPRVREQARAITGNDLGNASLWRPRLIAQLTGLNCMMMTVLAPRSAADTPLRVEHIEREYLLQIRVHGPDFTDTIVSGLGHGYIRTDDIVGHTELALIRRDPKGNVISQWTADGGPLQIKR